MSASPTDATSAQQVIAAALSDWIVVDDGAAADSVLDALTAAGYRLLPPGEPTPTIDSAHLQRQRTWSRETFGPGPRTRGVLDHIRRELAEIEAAPLDLSEWADVVILALDGAWRAGHEPQAIIDAIKVKQARNEARSWPDWRTASEDVAIEHVRTDGVPRGGKAFSVSAPMDPEAGE